MGAGWFSRNFGFLIISIAIIIVIVVSILIWRSNQAPVFYGTITAAIVAASAVIAGAHYQATLTRRRDEELRRQEQFAEAVDLCHWLEHAVIEMDFISSVLLGIGDHLVNQSKPQLDWPLEQYREVVSAQFMNELPARAKMASRLPNDIARPVAHALYRTYSIVDRIHRLRGVPDSFRATADHVSRHQELAFFEVKHLRDAHDLVEKYINSVSK
jgi:hypothetical protein